LTPIDSYNDVSFEAADNQFQRLDFNLQKAIITFIRDRSELFEWQANDQPGDPPNDGPALPVENSDGSEGGRHRTHASFLGLFRSFTSGSGYLGWIFP
jgi:hypothetical protein